MQALTELLGENVSEPKTIERLAGDAGLALGALRIHGATPRDAWSDVLRYAHRTGRVEPLLRVLRDHLPAFAQQLAGPIELPSYPPDRERALPLNEIIDFSAERRRHERVFFGREDVLAELARLVDLAPSAFVLLLGSPGMGKSAIALRWLDRRLAQGRPTPHHFLRRDYRSWDDPPTAQRNLAAQIESLYPRQHDPKEVTADTRLEQLLYRVSERELSPGGEKLVILVDGLDEARKFGAHDNPVKHILPDDLPDGIVIVCTSRPKYPDLGWLSQRGQFLPPLDLNAPKTWANSGRVAVEAYWRHQSGQFKPPLTSELVTAAIERSGGNFLHAVKVRQRLMTTPATERHVDALPFGLKGLLEALWNDLQTLPADEAEYVRQGLGLLCVAREALPARCVEAALGWPPGTADQRLLQTLARQAIVEEPAEWHGGETCYRLYHESFDELVREKMAGALPELHRCLAEHVATWPAPGNDAFRRSYASRHAVAHRREAAQNERDWQAIGRLCLNVDYLCHAVREAGASALEAELEPIAARCPVDALREALLDVQGSVTKESYWLREMPDALPSLLWNQLLRRGWTVDRLENELIWPPGASPYRLRHPLQKVDHSTKVFVRGDSGGHRLSSEKHPVACALTPDGLRALSSSADGVMSLWDVESGRELSRLTAHGGDIFGCALTPDGRLALSVGRSIRLWDLTSGHELWCFDAPEALHMACALTRDAKRALSCLRRNVLQVWDLERRRELCRFEAEGSRITSCAITDDGHNVLAGCADGSLRRWGIARGHAAVWRSAHEGAITACALSHDGSRALSGSNDRTLRLSDGESGRELLRLEGHSGGVIACALSPDVTKALSASADGTLRVWSLNETATLRRPTGHRIAIDSCALTADGARALSGSLDGSFRLWDVGTGIELSHVSVGRVGSVNACALGRNGDRVLVGEWSLELRESMTGLELLRLEGHTDKVTACALSRDERQALSGSLDHTLRLWDLQSGRELRCFTGHTDRVRACAFTPDGERVVSASYDGTVRVWRLDDGRELLRLVGHEGWVIGCAVSPDGARVVSGSKDRTVRVWCLESGREILCLRGHTDWVNACAVTPDGARAVTGSDDRTLRVWDLKGGHPLAVVCGIHPFRSVAAGERGLVAGDELGNIWFLTDQPLRRPASPP